jgi:hypothetical protein
LGGLAEAANSAGSRHLRPELITDLGHDVDVVSELLHGVGLAPHVHEDEARRGVANELEHARVPAARDVVHDGGPRVEGGPGHLGLSRVDGDGDVDLAGQALDDRNDSVAPSSGETGSAPGRVDSPPTSMTAAPSCAIRIPWETAAS